MKQVVQNYKTGKLKVDDNPAPVLRDGGVLVRNHTSLISSGTERSKVELASKGILGKIKSRPDQVKLVLNNLKQEGLLATLKKSINKLDTPISLGYSCAGEVISVGKNVEGFKTGDKVAGMGEGFAAHAEINYIPKNFCMKIPQGLNFEQAAFATVGAIAMQAVRQAKVSEGEKVVIIGLGLIGLLAAQIFRSLNVDALGLEIDEFKIKVANELGACSAISAADPNVGNSVFNFTQGRGADAVIITASSKSDCLGLAGRISAPRGRVVIVGVVPLAFPRKDFFEKELEIVISSAMGPGSYDKNYIEKGADFPKGAVAWTARDNLGDFLNLLQSGKVKVEKLITHEFPIAKAADAYKLLRSKKERHIAIILNYKQKSEKEPSVFRLAEKKIKDAKVNIGFIGAGSFTNGYLLPAIKKNSNINLIGVAAATGISSKNSARKFGFSYCTSDYKQILKDPKINSVFIATRHNLHARLVVEALKNKKSIFVEKPLAINLDELKEIISAYKENNGRVMIGFNRRFSPFTQKIKQFFKYRSGPLIINYRVNAGSLPADNWQHSDEGAGRIIGEACHFVDLLQFLCGAFPTEVYAQSVGAFRKDMPEEDNISVTIKFEDSSIGNIIYTALGDASLPRERIEAFADSSVAVVENFRRAMFLRGGRISKMSAFSRDMGHNNEMAHFIRSLKNNYPMPIDFKEMVYATFVTFKIIESIRNGEPQKIDIRDLSL